jgi:hypothetical protein
LLDAERELALWRTDLDEVFSTRKKAKGRRKMLREHLLQRFVRSVSARQPDNFS